MPTHPRSPAEKHVYVAIDKLKAERDALKAQLAECVCRDSTGSLRGPAAVLAETRALAKQLAEACALAEEWIDIEARVQQGHAEDAALHVLATLQEILPAAKKAGLL